MLCRFAIAMLLVVTTSSMAIADDNTIRVVSLDYCADQYLLKLLPPERILAVSPDADKHFSYMRDKAAGLNKVRPLAEDVLGLKPELVVRSYGGGPRVASLLNNAGVDVLQLPYANSLADIRAATLTIAEGLGVPERGVELAAEFDARLSALNVGDTRRTALYMTPTGVTSGPGTLVHEMLLAAGFNNFVTEAGWRSMPLERLAYEQPDVVAAAFFDIDTIRPELWSPMRHPIAQQQLKDRPTVMLQGAWTSCGAWFLLDAIEALAAA